MVVYFKKIYFHCIFNSCICVCSNINKFFQEEREAFVWFIHMPFYPTKFYYIHSPKKKKKNYYILIKKRGKSSYIELLKVWEYIWKVFHMPWLFLKDYISLSQINLCLSPQKKKKKVHKLNIFLWLSGDRFFGGSST